MTDAKFMQLCKRTIRDYVNSHLDKSDCKQIAVDDVYMV